MKEAITKDIAASEVSAWLDYKKIKPTQREEAKGSIDKLIEAVQYGIISIDNETFVISHELEFPVTGLVSKLDYKPRISGFELGKATKGAAGLDLVFSYISALTGCGVGSAQKLDSEDLKIASAIAGFF